MDHLLWEARNVSYFETLALGMFSHTHTVGVQLTGWSPQTRPQVTWRFLFPFADIPSPGGLPPRSIRILGLMEEGTTLWASRSLSAFILFRYRLQQLNALARLSVS